MAKKKRTYKNHGTNDFLILTIVCGVIGVWAIFDGWFPSQKVLKKHPYELILSFDQDGVVESINTQVGAPAVGVLAKLATASVDARLTVAQAAYEAADKSGNSVARSKTLAELTDLREKLLASELKVAPRYLIEMDENGVPQVDRAIFDEHDPAYEKGYEPKSAVVKEILIMENGHVFSGKPAFVLDTKDHFYPFNKVLTVVMVFGFVIFGWLHFQAKRN